jgi:hypothetical protein
MESLIGKVPYDWAQTLLGEVCHIVAGPSGGSLRHGIGVPREIPMITPKDLNGNRLVYDGIAMVEPATAAKLSRYQLAAGDIVCARTGDLT